MWARHLNGQRRERDSNPRHLRAAVFKTAPFDRSGISPGPLYAYDTEMVLDWPRIVNSLVVTFCVWAVLGLVARLQCIGQGLGVGVKFG